MKIKTLIDFSPWHGVVKHELWSMVILHAFICIINVISLTWFERVLNMTWNSDLLEMLITLCSSFKEISHQLSLI